MRAAFGRCLPSRRRRRLRTRRAGVRVRPGDSCSDMTVLHSLDEATGVRRALQIEKSGAGTVWLSSG
jgi:hypothetical protein